MRNLKKSLVVWIHLFPWKNGNLLHDSGFNSKHVERLKSLLKIIISYIIFSVRKYSNFLLTSTRDVNNTIYLHNKDQLSFTNYILNFFFVICFPTWRCKRKLTYWHFKKIYRYQLPINYRYKKFSRKKVCNTQDMQLCMLYHVHYMSISASISCKFGCKRRKLHSSYLAYRNRLRKRVGSDESIQNIMPTKMSSTIFLFLE